MNVGGGACEACGARKLQPSAARDHNNPVSGNQPGTISQQTSGVYLLRSRYENVTPNLCWVFFATFRVPFSFASSPLSESLEQATIVDAVISCHN